MDIGFKEIELAFPSASNTEYDFCRRAIETPGLIPDDVWVQALTPCRKELIRRTVDSLRGAKKAIISIYIGASDSLIHYMLRMSQQEVFDLAVDCVKYAKSISKDDPAQQETTWNLMFSPEGFSDTDINYSVRLCEAVQRAWEPTEDVPIILNLPATVERATPNVYADQVEIFSRSLSERNKVCVSTHTHNDRGCAVAATELALMAGADRVEGCLFGNGERTGNVDLVIMALNMYTQGVDPQLDFSNLDAIKTMFEHQTKIPIHCRAPYAGELVFRAYSGTHQDGINKGLGSYERACQDAGRQQLWKVPYLPIDPLDIGGKYEAIVRINSQSGKGGATWTIRETLGLELPRTLQTDFSGIVKTAANRVGRMLEATEVRDLFLQGYHVLHTDPRIVSLDFDDGLSDSLMQTQPSKRINAELRVGSQQLAIEGTGSDFLSAVQSAAVESGWSKVAFSCFEGQLNYGGIQQRLVMVECSRAKDGSIGWGMSVTKPHETALIEAALSAMVTCLDHGPEPTNDTTR